MTEQLARADTTLDLIKKAYAITVQTVACDDGVALPAWEKLPDGYRAAFIHMFTAANWNSEKLGYELKPASSSVLEAT